MKFEEKQWLIIFLVSVISSNFTAQAFAETDTQQLTKTEKKPTSEALTVTALRIPQAKNFNADNTTRLSQIELELVSHSHVQESLNRISGVNFNRGNGQEYLPAVRSPVLTGAGACGSVLSAVNGIALRPSGFCNINELFDALTEIAESIEIIKGPSTSFYGSNAMHGVINVIPKKVTDISESSLGVDIGEDDYYRIKLSSNQPINKEHGFRIDFSGSHDGGYFDDSGVDQQKISIRHQFINKRWKINNDFYYSNLNQETAAYVVGNDAYKNSTLRKSNPIPEAYRDSFTGRFSSRIEKNINDLAQLVVTPYIRHSKMEFLQHFLPGTPIEKNGHNSAGIQSAIYVEQNDHWQWAAGIDTEYTQGWLEQIQNTEINYSEYLKETIPSGQQYDYEVDTNVTALFGHSRLQLLHNTALTMGLRYEYARYNYKNKMHIGRTDANGENCNFDGCRYSRPADNIDSYNNLSPKIGLSVDINDNHQLLVALSQGFRAPQATELYRLQREQTIADLDSEELISAELGITGRLWPSSKYQVSLYQMKKRNVIFRDSDFFTVSNRKTKHQGIELSLDTELTNNLSLMIAANYSEHQYDDDKNLNNNLIDSAPRFFSNTRLNWKPSLFLQTELEWINMGSYYTDIDNQHSYSGHNVINWRSRYQLRPSCELYINIYNIGNKAYAERADYSNFSGERYFPGKKRNAMFGIKVSW